MTNHTYGLTVEQIDEVLDEYELPAGITAEDVMCCWDDYMTARDMHSIHSSEKNQMIWEYLDDCLEEENSYPSSVVELLDIILNRELISDEKPLNDETLFETLTEKQIQTFSESGIETPEFKAFIQDSGNQQKFISCGYLLIDVLNEYKAHLIQKPFTEFYKHFSTEKEYTAQQNIRVAPYGYTELNDLDMDDSQFTFNVLSNEAYPKCLVCYNNIEDLQSDIRHGVYNPASTNFGMIHGNAQIIKPVADFKNYLNQLADDWRKI